MCEIGVGLFKVADHRAGVLDCFWAIGALGAREEEDGDVVGVRERANYGLVDVLGGESFDEGDAFPLEVGTDSGEVRGSFGEKARRKGDAYLAAK